jgi:hypothetical protein
MSAFAEAVRVRPGVSRLARPPRTPLLRWGSLAGAALGLLVGAALGEPQAIVTAALGLALGAAIVWFGFRTRPDERSFLLTLFLVAFGLRVVAATASHFGLLYLGKGGFMLLDDRAYDKLGWTLARVWMGIFPGIRDSDQYLMVNYTYLVASVYYFLGHSLLAAKMLNVAFGAITGVAIYAVGAEIFDRRTARLAALLTAFFPSLIVWSVINLKDILVTLLTITAVFGFLRYARRHQWWALLLALVALATIENLRQFVFFILAWLMPVAFLFADRSTWRRKLVLLVPLVIGVATLNYATSNEKFGTNFLTPKALTEAEWKRWLEERDAGTGIDDMGGVKPPKDMSTIVERSAAYLPKGIYFVLLGPTPWDAPTPMARAVIPEMLIWYGLLAAALAGLIQSARRSWRDLVLPLGFTAAWIVALALTEGNTGNIFRHRSQFLPFVFLLSAVGLPWLWERWQARRQVSARVAVV